MVGFPETSFLSLSYLLYDDHTLFPKVFWILPLVFCVLETCPGPLRGTQRPDGKTLSTFPSLFFGLTVPLHGSSGLERPARWIPGLSGRPWDPSLGHGKHTVPGLDHRP